MKKLFLFLSFLLSPALAHATTWYACTAGGNWSSATAWTSVMADQGTCAASLGNPAAGDTAILNSSSGNVTIASTSDAAAIVTATGYTGTLTFTSGQKLTVTGNVTWGSGMTITGTGTLVFGGSLTYTSNGVAFSGSWSIGAFTITLEDITETLTGGLTLTGSATINSDTLNIGGGITQANFQLQGTTALVMNGSGTWTNTGGSTSTPIVNNLTFNTAGTIVVSGTVYYKTGTLTYTAGTITVTSSTLNLAGNCTLNTSGMNWNNISVTTGTSTFTLTSALNSTGTLTIASGGGCTFSGAFGLSFANVNAYASGASTTLTLVSGQTLTITNSMQLVGLGNSMTLTLKSATSSSSTALNFTGTSANCVSVGVIFTDINAAGSSQPIYNFEGGTLTRTTNISNKNQSNFSASSGVGFVTL